LLLSSLSALFTLLNVPAWSQQVVVRTESSAYAWIDSMEQAHLPNTWKEFLAVLSILQFLEWPAFMFVYATKSVPNDGASFMSITNTVCFAAGDVSASAFIWAFIGTLVAGSESWGFLKGGSFTIAGGAFFLSKFLVFSLGRVQAFQGDRNIFLIPAKQWNIPHISGYGSNDTWIIVLTINPVFSSNQPQISTVHICPQLYVNHHK
jgi:hypothetical protein